MAAPRQRLVLCLRNEGYEVSLERRKIYSSLPDADAAKHGQIRVVDESGEDYLYPAEFFAPIDLPDSLRFLEAVALGGQFVEGLNLLT